MSNNPDNERQQLGNAIEGFVYPVRNATLSGYIKLPETESISTVDVFADTNLLSGCEMQRISSDNVAEGMKLFEFTCDLTTLNANKTYLINLIHSTSQYNFNCASIKYNPKIGKWQKQLLAIFHFSFYINRYLPGEQSPSVAFEHFLEYGIFEDFDPNPWISSRFIRERYSNYVKSHHLPILKYLEHEQQGNIAASEYFHPRRYLKQNPDVGEGVSPMGHYVSEGHAELRNTEHEKLADQIQEEISELAELDPIIKCSRLNGLKIVKYPQISHSIYTPTIIKKINPIDSPIVIAVPSYRDSDSFNVIWFVIKTLQEKFGSDSIIVIVTDQKMNDSDGMHARTVSREPAIVDLETLSQVCGEEQRINLFHHVLAELAPSAVININSKVAWNVFEKYGRQLSARCNLYGYLFCFEQEEARRRSGYIVDHFPYALKYLKQVYFDNFRVYSELTDVYGFSRRSKEKFKSLKIPCREDICNDLRRRYRMSENKRKNSQRRVLWVAQLSRRRKVSLLIEIADSMRDVTFDVYGTEGDDLDCIDVLNIINARIPNLNYKGVFRGLETIKVVDYHAFLYTSQYDGIPPIIINVMAIGIPVCATDVGGIGELVTANTGWLVSADAGVERYQTMLRMILSDLQTVQIRTANGIKLVAENHSYEIFRREFMPQDDDKNCSLLCHVF